MSRREPTPGRRPPGPGRADAVPCWRGHLPGL